MTGILKIVVRIANLEDPDQTASSEPKSDQSLRCLSYLAFLALTTSVEILKTYHRRTLFLFKSLMHSFVNEHMCHCDP